MCLMHGVHLLRSWTSSCYWKVLPLGKQQQLPPGEGNMSLAPSTSFSAWTQELPLSKDQALFTCLCTPPWCLCSCWITTNDKQYGKGGRGGGQAHSAQETQKSFSEAFLLPWARPNRITGRSLALRGKREMAASWEKNLRQGEKQRWERSQSTGAA